MNNIDKSADRTRIVPVNYGERSGGEWFFRSFTYADFVASGDTLDLIVLPANSFLRELYYVPKVVFNGTPVLSVGDSSGINYMSTSELTEDDAALVSSMNAPDAGASYPKKGALPFYATADKLRVKLSWSSPPTTGEGGMLGCISEIPSY